MEYSLYQITSAFPKLMEQDDISEEDKKEIEKELTQILKQKSNGIIGYARNVELTIKAMKEEEDRLEETRKKLEKRLNHFKDYVIECMARNNLTKIDTDLGSLALAKSPISVEIINEDEIPEEFKREVVTTKIDKKAITDNFRETGEIPNGVKINTDNTYLKIK